MPNKVVIKKRADFKEYVNNNTNVIVKIGATWCGPCKRCSPTVNKLFEALPDNVSMVLIDADECSDVKNYLKIKIVPTLIFFRNGERQEIYQTSNENEILNFFETVMSYVS
jgi:thioredoxin 1